MSTSESGKPRPGGGVPGGRKPYHHGDLRRALLDAAWVELRAHGWAALSLRGVARRAGVTHAAAYHHFESRQAILLALALEGFDRLDAHLHAAMEAAGGDAVDRLCAATTGYVHAALEDPPAYELMFNVKLGGLPDEDRARKARPFQRVVDAVDAARRASGVTTSDTMTDAFLQWELAHGIAMLASSGDILAERFGSVEAHARAVSERTRALYRR